MDKTIYIIAGEASGDAIGGGLMAALKAQQPDLHFEGIGGDAMRSQGLLSLFDMHQLSLMGFAEVVPHIARLKTRIYETVHDILDKEPDILITIDSPGFVFRVVKALRKRGFAKPCIHYVAPTVWAYKPERAVKTAKLFDALLCILPFEPPYFRVRGLKTYFVGHPIAWQHRQHGDGLAFREKHEISADAAVLGMMPGSRKGELARHMPIFRETAVRLRREYRSLTVVMPTNEAILMHVKSYVDDWPLPVTLTCDPAEKADAFAACELALAKSGTVALETALAGIPTITTFRAHPLSVWLVRRMIQVPYVNLLNIMALFEGNKPPIPELIQEKCNPTTLSKALRLLADHPKAQDTQRLHCAGYFRLLGMEDDDSPSDKAASIVLNYIVD